MSDEPDLSQQMDAWVPHRGAMSLLATVERLFATPQGVPAWVGIEYMAQAVAAWSGAKARKVGGSPRIGYLLGCRRYEAAVPVFEAGAELVVHAQCELTAENGLGMFDCRIEQDGRVLANGRLSVFEPPQDPGEGASQSARGEQR
jgi:predicted hotdog family 3-hydroxylacyl-ACP dehydratase